MNVILFLTMEKWIISLIIGYALGSIPFSYILVRLVEGFDLRTKGSGNLGTTNVLRTLGFGYAVLNYVLDMLKGAVSFLIIRAIFGTPMDLVAGLGAIFGHCFSPFVDFKGGKGVAVASGLLLASDARMFLVLVVIQFVMLFMTRRMSAGSITSAACAPIIAWFFNGKTPIFYAILLAGAFVIFQHRANISRLLRGEEKPLF